MTQNPACIAAHQYQYSNQQLPHSPAAAPDDVSMADANENILDILGFHENNADDTSKNPPQLIKDYFGTHYMEDELRLENDGAESNEEDDDDDTDVPVAPVAGEDVELRPVEDSEDERVDGMNGVQGIEPEHAEAEGDVPQRPETCEEAQCTRIENALQQQVHVERFPSDVAGQPIPHVFSAPRAGYADYGARVPRVGPADNIYAPPGSMAVSELLEIPGLQDKLELLYKNTRELNKLVDALLTTRPKFMCNEIVVADEAFDVYMRNVVECLKALFGDAEFAQYLVFLPERHYADTDQTVWLYYDMHTGKWWWAVQKVVEEKTPGATIMPIIISSDKTQVTLFRNKTAYPVYLTIRNLPKDIRGHPSQRGQILIAYLLTSKLDHITNKAAHRQTLTNLFHACMECVFEPLKTLGQTGLPMTSGDGITRRIHLIFAAYVGDYPEQLLVTGVKTGLCTVCAVPHDELGDFDATYPWHNIHDVRTVLAIADGPGPPSDYVNACCAQGMKPIYHPFWMNLPYSNIFLSITPDILHQILQGFMKHLIAWIKMACNAAEIDARCRQLPPNHNVHLFLKGITPLSQLTGQKHADICRILLGIIIDLPLPNNIPSALLVCAVRVMLDFIYLAQYLIHSDDSLQALDNALRHFHENKYIFVDMGVHQDFNIPKLHYCSKHWHQQVEFFGIADNFNTEFTECLHIDFAKEAYRATNKKNEYSQMTLWLECKEKVLQHDRHIKMPKNPSTKAQVSFKQLGTHYGATQFRSCLAEFVAQRKHLDARPAALREHAALQRIHFHKVQVYHKARPARYNKHGHETAPGRFDMALINDGTGGAVGIKGYRVGCVRVIFSIPRCELPSLSTPDEMDSVPEHLAYIEWFTPFRHPDVDHALAGEGRDFEMARSLTQNNQSIKMDCYGNLLPTASLHGGRSSSIHEHPEVRVTTEVRPLSVDGNTATASKAHAVKGACDIKIHTSASSADSRASAISRIILLLSGIALWLVRETIQTFAGALVSAIFGSIILRAACFQDDVLGLLCGYAAARTVLGSSCNYPNVTLAETNWATYSAGARIVNTFTSPTHVIQDRVDVAFVRRLLKRPIPQPLPPDTILRQHHLIGDCWPMSGTSGHIGIALAQPLHVTNVTILHLTGGTDDAGSAPRSAILWGISSRPLQQHFDHHISSPLQAQLTMVLDPRTVVPLAKVFYDIHTRLSSQWFIATGCEPIEVSTVIFEVLDNWGESSFTCLYGLYIHGDHE
ncbi:hypothetical protein NM688_g1669 [Phlebia brevispora]|uniref:Uncharacterized protein n=1 Tax=Phlebia brevispora TaxID=194682 RepID=A0ACC1TBG8_9APHY|nr:hypothetical protein NM688_g1669 [Phlebia brevispora]